MSTTTTSGEANSSGMENFDNWSNSWNSNSNNSQWWSGSEGGGEEGACSSASATSTSTFNERKQEMNALVLERIESTIVEILRAVAEDRLPELAHVRQEKTLPIRGSNEVQKQNRQKDSKDINNRNNNNEKVEVFDLTEEVVADDVAVEVENKETEAVPKVVVSRIRFEKQASQKKFTVILNLMAKVYSLILKGQTCTKRDLFYENVPLYGTQARLEQGLQDMCLILKVPRSAIGVKATAKGLVAGNLIYKDGNGMEVDVSHSSTGLLIPSVDEGIYEIQSNAKFILLVEKDAVFQRLIGECIFETMGPMIMVTGKGYPDFGTRKFIHVLSKELKVPVLALVDCDPHGIEIAAIVKWGSYGQANLARCTDDSYAQELLVPDLVWAGLRPSDIDSLNLRKASVEMNGKDERKLESVKMRLAGQPDASDWCSQIDILKSLKVKTELESLFSCGFRFATQIYLKRKVNELLKKDK